MKAGEERVESVAMGVLGTGTKWIKHGVANEGTDGER